MKRLEIIGNKSIEEDLFDTLREREITNYYTKLPAVHGNGKSGPKMGDSTWPEENFLIIIYCTNEEADKIIDAVKHLKGYFPNEGLKLFEIEVDMCL